MHNEQATCDHLAELLRQITTHLEEFQRFEHPDAVANIVSWKSVLSGHAPEKGIGASQVIAEMGEHVIPNGSQISKPGCTSYITTAATDIGSIATLAGIVASPQRIGVTAFNHLEGLALKWLAEMFGLPKGMQGVFSSGGSTANLIGLGAARQWAFKKIGIDAAADGVQRACRIYATEQSHHTVHRAVAVLGMGRRAMVHIAVDDDMRMSPEALRKQLQADEQLDTLPVAIVANAGSTNTGSIDPLQEIGEIAHEYNIWFHVDGAYGLPGTLDPNVNDLYRGLTLANSITVDAHKWLGAPVGIGATFVRDYNALHDTFTQGDADYIESTVVEEERVENSMDAMGFPYHDLGVELSAPTRGAIVWALIREIGVDGMRARICRHNEMARRVAEQAKQHPNLELALEPTLSICCFSYVHEKASDLNGLNKKIHRQLMKNGVNIPSTTMVGDKFVIRPCFLGARTDWHHADDLVNEVIDIGNKIMSKGI
ncbi:MAG: aminotransferase class V-fold PLP-dependent enzyme [Cycloclasticus sp.]|jgi:glutamate/tyrosine decarboxylase-like PLP-dependent enzyme|nr:aminotransferase class V-fold PLP-dependent enzyme [Cycloclasticus sp.]HIL91506.1 aminotransferase class V-fold PLP-dependent enzyme [Cycloclasticus sp.]